MKYHRTELYSVPELKKRGWTKTLIRKYLPDPDQTQINPRFPKRPRMKFFLKWVVEKTEKAPVFAKAMRAAREQSERMKRAVAELSQQGLSPSTIATENKTEPAGSITLQD